MSTIGRIQFGKRFLKGQLLYIITQSLIDWSNECSWHQLSTIAQPWTTPVLRAWTQLTYFLSFSTSSVFSLHFARSRIFYFAQCPKRQGGVNNLRVTLVWVKFPVRRLSIFWYVSSTGATERILQRIVLALWLKSIRWKSCKKWLRKV